MTKGDGALRRVVPDYLGQQEDGGNERQAALAESNSRPTERDGTHTVVRAG